MTVDQKRVVDLLRRLHPDREVFTLDDVYEAMDILWGTNRE